MNSVAWEILFPWDETARPEWEVSDPPDYPHGYYMMNRVKNGYGEAVDPAELPRALRLTRVWEPLVDILRLWAYVVPERVRAIIEGLEPGVHQFIPVELRRSDGAPTNGPHYWLNILQQLDFVDPDQSWLSWHQDSHGRWFGTYGLGDDWLVAREEAIAGRHLWCSRGNRPEGFFASDALKQALEAEGVTGWQFWHVLEGRRPEGNRPENATEKPLSLDEVKARVAAGLPARPPQPHKRPRPRRGDDR